MSDIREIWERKVGGLSILSRPINDVERSTEILDILRQSPTGRWLIQQQSITPDKIFYSYLGGDNGMGALGRANPLKNTVQLDRQLFMRGSTVEAAVAAGHEFLHNYLMPRTILPNILERSKVGQTLGIVGLRYAQLHEAYVRSVHEQIMGELIRAGHQFDPKFLVTAEQAEQLLKGVDASGATRGVQVSSILKAEVESLKEYGAAKDSKIVRFLHERALGPLDRFRTAELAAGATNTLNITQTIGDIVSRITTPIANAYASFQSTVINPAAKNTADAIVKTGEVIANAVVKTADVASKGMTAVKNVAGAVWDGAQWLANTQVGKYALVPALKVAGFVGGAVQAVHSFQSAINSNNGLIERTISSVEAAGYTVSTGTFASAGYTYLTTPVTNAGGVVAGTAQAAFAATTFLVTSAVSEVARDGAILLGAKDVKAGAIATLVGNTYQGIKNFFTTTPAAEQKTETRVEPIVQAAVKPVVPKDDKFKYEAMQQPALEPTLHNAADGTHTLVDTKQPAPVKTATVDETKPTQQKVVADADKPKQASAPRMAAV